VPRGCQWFSAGLLALVIFGSQVRAESVDAALQAVARFRATMAERRDRFTSIEASYTAVQESPEESRRSEVVHYFWTAQRQFRYDQELSLADGPDKGRRVFVVNAFDGEKAIVIAHARQEAVISAQPSLSGPLFVEQCFLIMGSDCATEMTANPIEDVSLKEKVLTFTVESRNNKDLCERLTVDTASNTIVSSESFVNGILTNFDEYSDYRDLGDGLLFPFSHKRWFPAHGQFSVRDSFDSSKVKSFAQLSATSVKVNVGFPKGWFTPEIPLGYRVCDAIANVEYISGRQKGVDDVVASVVNNAVRYSGEKLFSEVGSTEEASAVGTGSARPPSDGRDGKADVEQYDGVSPPAGGYTGWLYFLAGACALLVIVLVIAKCRNHRERV
jgi:hypothetical protein